MKIAIAAQHANPLHPRAGASPRPDDARLGELTRILARQGHRMTRVLAEAQPDVPDRTELGGGLRVMHIPVGAAGAVTKTARLLASKGPQSTHVRNS